MIHLLPDPLPLQTALQAFHQWRAETPGGVAALIGSWAALAEAERELATRADVHLLAVNQTLLDRIPQLEALIQGELSAVGRQQVQRVLQRVWQQWLGELRNAGETWALKNLELVFACRLDLGVLLEVADRQVHALLLLPGHYNGRDAWLYPGPEHEGWPLDREWLAAVTAWPLADLNSTAGPLKLIQSHDSQ